MPTKRVSRKSVGPSASHTPVVSPPTRQRPPSPLSPTRISRMEEKREMQTLNDRLAAYIELVRSKEAECSNLQQQISSIEEVRTSEVITLKRAYDDEIAHLRATVDEISRERARFEVDAERNKKEAWEAKSKLKEKEKALENALKDLKSSQSRLASMSSDYESVDKELRELRPENARLLKKLEDAKKNLEDETLKRVDLQNQLQTQQENFKFESSLLEKQLNETRVRKSLEISELDGNLREEYEEKLQSKLAELRDSYENEISQNKEAFNQLFEDKLKGLQKKLDEEKSRSFGNVQEMRELETKVTALTSKNAELSSMREAMESRIRDLEEELDNMKRAHRNEMARKDAELINKEEQIEENLREYRELLDVKIALDAEIKIYKSLLEGEEARMNLSGQISTPGRGVKRKRTSILEEESVQLTSDHYGKGNIAIEPLDKEGKYIEVKNVSDGAICIGGWSLSNFADEDEVAYKFHRSTTLQPGETCRVWSSDVQEEHNPPNNLIMKKGGWTIGDENKTVLVNKDNEEEACRVSKKEKSLTGSLRYGTSTLYHQRSDDQKCLLM